MTDQTGNTDYKGFSLFNDIENAELRNRNRAVVLANIAADNTKNRIIHAKGAALILGYFKEVPEHDREDVKERFKENMKEQGFVLAG
jgi:hypothetical protein